MTVTREIRRREGGGPGAGLRRWLAFVLPRPCLGCGAEVGTGRDNLGLCLPCRGKLSTAPLLACTACGRAAPASAAAGEVPRLCPSCRGAPPPFEALFAVWSYAPPFDRVVHALKFRRLDYLADDLARGIARRWGAELADCEVVVPVPLHWQRRLRRGFDQAELIAKPLAQALDRPLAAALRRARRTRPQARLGRRQRTGGENPFRSRLETAVAGRRVLLVDDVVTTGATLGAAARELRRAGAAAVVAVAAGRTPPD